MRLTLLTITGTLALLTGWWIALTPGTHPAAPFFLYLLAFTCMAVIANITSTTKDHNS